MKNILKSTTVLALASIAFFSFKDAVQASIKGTVTPADSAGNIWAIQGTDSVKATASAGSFTLSVKPGTYQVVVEGKAPYKNLVRDSVAVKEGETTDLGTLTLQQQ